MSDGNGRDVTVTDLDSVEIPLDNRNIHISRKSSTSTSSFEDFGETKTKKKRSNASDPPTLEVDEQTPKSSPPKGVALTFKTRSFDDPTYYAQSTSSPSSPQPSSAHVHVRTPTPRLSKDSSKMAEDDRDPENVNEIVKIKFEEVFAEPEGTYSFGTIWGASFKIFTDSKMWCYKFLSALCGVPCALCWGVNFACLSFCQIWYYQPGIRSLQIQIRPLAKVFTICIKAFIDPCFDAFGRLLSSIRVHVSRD